MQAEVMAATEHRPSACAPSAVALRCNSCKNSKQQFCFAPQTCAASQTSCLLPQAAGGASAKIGAAVISEALKLKP
jgi:hypothetical protein